MRRSITMMIGLFALTFAGAEVVRGQTSADYSNDLDEEAVVGGGAHNGLSVGQVLSTVLPDPPGPPNPSNGPNFGATAEVDALGDEYDLTEFDVIGNNADLLVSFAADPGGNALHFERPGGLRGIRWTQVDFCNPNPAGNLEDVDGVALDAPAQYSSKLGDVGGTSVHSVIAGPWVTHVIVVDAVQFLGCTAPEEEIDLDALMVQDLGEWGVWDEPDIILFSIRAAGNFDGGELIVLPFAGPATFLTHGGHLWNTEFNVAGAFGVGTEEIDAVDAAATPIPTVSEWGLIVMTLLVLTAGTVVLGRRRRAAAA